MYRADQTLWGFDSDGGAFAYTVAEKCVAEKRMLFTSKFDRSEDRWERVLERGCSESVCQCACTRYAPHFIECRNTINSRRCGCWFRNSRGMFGSFAAPIFVDAWMLYETDLFAKVRIEKRLRSIANASYLVSQLQRLFVWSINK